MKHIIATRFLFNTNNWDLMDWYMEVCNNTLIPSLQSQSNKNFTWGIIISSEHEEWFKNKVNNKFEYVVFNDYETFKNSDYNLQTRHDIDDIMHPDYVNAIQNAALNCSYDEAIIHTNLVIVNYFTREERIYPVYNNKNTSSFVSMWQKNLNHSKHIYMCEHTKLCEIIPNVIELPIGLCKQVKHGKNLSK